MELKDAYETLALPHGASINEVKEAFRVRVCANLHHQIKENEDEEEWELRVEETIKTIKALNTAKTALLKEAADFQPEAMPKEQRQEDDDDDLRRFGVEWKVGEQQSHPIPSASNHPIVENSEPVGAEYKNDKQEKYNPLVDPELHRLITEWRIRRTQKDYKPYSEEELRRLGAQWKVGVVPPQKAEHVPSDDEIHRRLQELETIYKNLNKITDKFYELAWTRRTPDCWDHIWLTLHLAGATVEEVWEITGRKWPKVLKERGSLGPREEEKLRKFIETSRRVLLQCDSVLRDFDPERERACCLKLYKALRAFPIALCWRRKTSWEIQDKAMRRQGFGILNGIMSWPYSIIFGG
ncbi:hypothetical protein HD806DRAFT_518130 [Xylariaceae sp. AK1471]|nr:hypothetical protein HD806DRAFT_518130 [Xylariaceae sp. AK1471]